VVAVAVAAVVVGRSRKPLKYKDALAEDRLLSISDLVL